MHPNMHSLQQCLKLWELCFKSHSYILTPFIKKCKQIAAKMPNSNDSFGKTKPCTFFHHGIIIFATTHRLCGVYCTATIQGVVRISMAITKLNVKSAKCWQSACIKYVLAKKLRYRFARGMHKRTMLGKKENTYRNDYFSIIYRWTFSVSTDKWNASFFWIRFFRHRNTTTYLNLTFVHHI